MPYIIKWVQKEEEEEEEEEEVEECIEIHYTHRVSHPFFSSSQFVFT